MSLMHDLSLDVRHTLGRAARWAVVGLVAFGIVLAVASVLAYQAFVGNRPTAPEIPITDYTPAVIEVFDCVRQGEACPQYEQSRTWLIAQTPDATSEAGGLLYTPVTQDDPGTPTADGFHLVVLDEATTRETWQAVAEAVTRGGRANPATVTETTAALDPVDANVGVFTLPATDDGQAPLSGRMTFTINQGGPMLTRVEYSEAGEGTGG